MEVKIIIAYLLIANFIGFQMMMIDKLQAMRGGRRISEKNLFLAAFLGGGIGETFSMVIFRHKTRHWYFKLGLPLISLFHLVAVGVYLYARGILVLS